MTQRLADVVRQIQSVRQLEAVVTAMRGIAASQAQKGRSLLSGIDAYSKVISRAIGQALTLLPPDMAAAPPLRRARTRPHPVLRRAGLCRSLQRTHPGRGGSRYQRCNLLGRRDPRRSRRERARNKARLVRPHGHPHRHDSKFREPVGRCLIWLCRHRPHCQGRHSVFTFGIPRRHPNRPPFIAAHRLRTLRAPGG